jgi:hypothetical protein
MKFEQGFQKPSRPQEVSIPTNPEQVAQIGENTEKALEKEVETPSVYDFEKLSPALQEAVTERVERMLEITPLDKRYLSGVFNKEQTLIAPEELAYFQAYGRLAVRQLVMGDFFGDEEPIKEESEVLRELKERPFGGTSAGPREYEDIHLVKTFDRGSELLHDIAHTWVDLAESNNHADASNMIPKFLRYKKSLEKNEAMKEASAHDESIVTFYNTEGVRSRGGILKSIRKAKSREEFLSHDYLNNANDLPAKTEPPAFKKYIRGKIYDEYQANPNLLFDIFIESTLPLMKKYAPVETASLEYLRTSGLAGVF